MMNRKRLMALSGVLAFVLVIGAVAVVAARDGDGPRPASNLPKLAYGTDAEGHDRGGLQASLAPAFPVTYEVRGTLPALSETAPAYTLKPDTSRDRINRVAAALGVPADRVVVEQSTAPESTGRLILVVWQGRWSLVTAPAGCSTSSDGVSTCTSVGVVTGSANASSAVRAPDDCPMPPCPAGQSCAQVCPSTGEPVPMPAPPPPVRPADLPSQQEAERIGRDVLAKSGVDLDHADVQVTDGFTSWSVMASPRIDGFATQGLETTVVIGAKGAIEGGYGSLVTLTKVGDYPLAGTSVGLERLKSGRFAGPVPMMAAGGQPAPAVAVDSRPSVSAPPALPSQPVPAPAPDAKQPLPAPAPEPVPADPAPPVEQKVVITGVHVALMRSFGSGDEQSLVPVYVFETDPAGAKPFLAARLFPVPAVTDALLATDPTPPIKP
jgi:hypothetical protein